MAENGFPKAAYTDGNATTQNKELQSFHSIINYLSKSAPATAEECKSLCKLTFLKMEWTWNKSYQDLYERAEALTKRGCVYEIP